MDFEKAVSYCSTSAHVFLMNGSTHNRKYNEDRRKKRKEVEAALCPSIHGAKVVPGLFDYTPDELPNRWSQSAAIKQRREQAKRKLRKISKATAQKIRLKANAFFYTGEARTFATLTFIDDVTDQKAVQCLKNLMNLWRKEWGVKFHYLWVVERQEDTKRAHFHIMLSKYVDIKEENARWVRIQYNAGLTGKSKEGVKYSRDDIEKFIADGKLGKHLNPFDIKKINTIDALASYLTKYITKSVKPNDEFDCITWHCSRGISQVFTRSIIMPELFGELLTMRNSEIRKKDSDKGKAGELRMPVLHRGEGGWCNFVFVINRKYFHKYFEEMNIVNRGILVHETHPVVEQISETQYYNEFCRNYSEYEVEISQQKYNNVFNPSKANDLRVDFSDEYYVTRKMLLCLNNYN